MGGIGLEGSSVEVIFFLSIPGVLPSAQRSERNRNGLFGLLDYWINGWETSNIQHRTLNSERDGRLDCWITGSVDYWIAGRMHGTSNVNNLENFQPKKISARSAQISGQKPK